ncbi:uncharacterized protein Dvar_14630 [Desulfosarcina variabilis str. Montpellier]|uniref:hypothetical protein n=1 Tax=Desulfosarcina variabilis TaxID=2300 RepID=UPI003AFA0D29
MAEAAWRQEWVLPGGKLDYPAEGFEYDWDYPKGITYWVMMKMAIVQSLKKGNAQYMSIA